ncbi:MAG: PAS domain S-box protein [Deltaproteobacteria bacterium]|nr:PAS domain S-box protein [Deltaproteobacteria bacterium]
MSTFAGLHDPLALLEEVFARAPMGLQVYGADGTSLLVNPAFNTIFGAVPPPGYNVLQDEKLERRTAEFLRRVFAGESLLLPATWYDPLRADYGTMESGGLSAVETVGFPLLDGQGQVRHAVMLFTDVTERLRSEKARGETELRFRRIVELAHEGVWTLDEQDRTTFVNPRMAEMLGWPPEELLGRSPLDFFDEPWRSRATGGIARQRLGHPGRAELQMRRRDGRPLWVLLSATPLTDEAGAYHGSLALLTDVTDRKLAEEEVARSERRFRAIVEHGADVITLHDADGALLYASPSVRRVLGYDPEELRHLDLLALVHPDDRARAEQEVPFVVAHPATPHRSLLRVRHRDGRWRSMETVTVNLLHDPDVRAVVSNQQDVTERGHLEEQLRHAQKMDAVGRLAGGVAHDLNNVLSVIQGFGEMIEPELPNEEVREDLREILRAAERARTLTRQLLAFGRRQVLNPEVLDLNGCVTGLQRMLGRVLGEHIDIHLRLHQVPLPAKADAGQLEQVILNLALNARDAMPTGGRLTIATGEALLDQEYARHHADVRPGEYVTLTVSDEGSGMAPEVRERIFEPFFTTKAAGKGTGLGLATVFGIVTQSGGHIGVQSEVGAGTSFTIFLPRASAPPDERAERPGPRPGPPGRETVLVVEDDEGVRRFVMRALGRHGYQLLEAPGGREALEVHARHSGSIDLLLTDVVMPAMSGPELAQALRARQPELRVLFMSGYADGAVSSHGALVAGTHFMEKPLTVEELTRRVRRALDES